MGTKPYLISAVLGNSRMLVTLTSDGEMQRLFWPHVDGEQHVERLLGGLAVDGGPVLWQDGDGWRHSQGYEPDQNVLVTRSVLETTGIAVTYVDAAVPGRDLLVRSLRIANEGTHPARVRYVLYQWLRVDENPLSNTVLFDEAVDALVHYRRGTFIGMGADRPITDVAVGDPEEVWRQAGRAVLSGPGIRHGDVAGAALWDLGTLNPGESRELTLFWALGRRIEDIRALLALARTTGGQGLLAETRAYWTRWLSRAVPLEVPPAEPREGPPLLPGLPAQPASPEAIVSLYRRSLLVFKLMADEQTGAVIAAPEVDPAFVTCGGYAYCWGRDAAYITTAMDLAGYHGLAAAFYRWAVRTQEPEGWWMHRHLSTGQWGPSWGLLQVDETGSILYGMALHARLYGGKGFVESVWSSVSRAAEWLIRYRDPETGLPQSSWDLWEERQAQWTYSSAAVYAGLTAAAAMARTIGRAAEAERYEQAAAEVREAILRETVRDGRFLRGRFQMVSEAAYREAVAAGRSGRIRTGPKGHPIYELSEDPTPDLSLLGLSVPFGVVDADHPVMVRTAEHLVDALWAPPGGGLRRYQGDPYRGGNPWILGTLWLGQYAAARGDLKMARAMLDWAVARQSATGLLAEQVDAVSGEPVWILPLTWSHAMYVLLVLQLFAPKRAHTTSGGGSGVAVPAGQVLACSPGRADPGDPAARGPCDRRRGTD